MPDQVSHSFEAKLVLNHPFALNPLIIPFTYEEEDLSETSKKSVSSKKEEQNTQSESPSQEAVKDQKAEKVSDEDNPSILTYIIIIIFSILVLIFLCVTILQIDVTDFFNSRRDYYRGRNPYNDRSYNSTYNRAAGFTYRSGNTSMEGIREPRGYKKQVVSRDTSYNTD